MTNPSCNPQDERDGKTKAWGSQPIDPKQSQQRAALTRLETRLAATAPQVFH